MEKNISWEKELILNKITDEFKNISSEVRNQ